MAVNEIAERVYGWRVGDVIQADDGLHGFMTARIVKFAKFRHKVYAHLLSVFDGTAEAMASSRPTLAKLGRDDADWTFVSRT